MNRKGDQPLVPLARRLRGASTEAEARLWSRLRNRALGVKFRRQVPRGEYILDFFCHERGLVIELDGAHHLEPGQAEADLARTLTLEAQGLTVIRFVDNEILCSTDSVVQRIADLLDARPHPRPSPGGRGEPL